MRTITLSGDEANTLVAVLHGTSGNLSMRSRETHRDYLGLEMIVEQTRKGIAIRREGRWKLSEIESHQPAENTFNFEGDEDEFRRDLVLTKIIM